MIRNALAVLITLLAFMGSTAFAGDRSGGCDSEKVAGSYVGLRPNTFSGSGFGLLDQLILNKEGTAYWYQSSAFDLFVTTGTYIPQIGSWKCIDGRNLVVTTVGVTYASVGNDIVKSQNTRFTQKISVIDDKTLQTVARVQRFFLLTDDPLGSNVVGTTTFTDQFQYKRIKPFKNDVP